MGVFTSAAGTEVVFWGVAVFGTIFFFLRVAVMVIGGFGADMADHHGDAGAGHAGAEGPHSNSLDNTDPAFKLISINSLTGFFMMFGWSGLAAYKQFHLGSGPAFLVALAVGVLSMYATALVVRFMVRLHSPGERFAIEKAVGLTGSVYQRIPVSGHGRVQLSVDGAMRYVDAVSEDGAEIDSFKDITVVRVVDQNTVAVRKCA